MGLRATPLHQHLDLVKRCRPQSHDAVGEQREERDRRRDDDLRTDAVTEPNHDDGCDRDLRHGLERHDVRVENAIGERHEGDDESQQQPRACAEEKTGEDLIHGYGKMPDEIAAQQAISERHGDCGRRWQHDLADAEQVYDGFPAADKYEKRQQRQQYDIREDADRVSLAHTSRFPAELKCARMRATKRPNSGVLCIASVRGLGSSTGITWPMRPRPAVITPTPSPIDTPSRTSSV